MEQITGGLMERFRGKTLITQVFIIIFGVSTLLITLVCSLVAVQTREAFINNNNLKKNVNALKNAVVPTKMVNLQMVQEYNNN